MAVHNDSSGQIMSPQWIVDKVLDSAGYKGSEILSKKVMEPSFGDGNFLVEIIERIIREGRGQGLSNESLSEIIHTNIYGVEKDSVLYSGATKRINSLLMDYEIPLKEWSNLYNEDTLEVYKRFRDMDFVVGNPPYVRVRNSLLRDFRFGGKGVGEIYVIFYEMGLDMLSDRGTLCFITPSTFIGNSSQKQFRKYLADRAYIKEICDFMHSRVFERADTYTCITVLIKSPNTEVRYSEWDFNNLIKSSIVSVDCLRKTSDTGWRFVEDSKDSIPLKEIVDIRYGITTNLDGVYVHGMFEDSNLSVPYTGRDIPIVYFEDEGVTYPVERKILKKCVKASRFEGDNAGNLYMIFPYLREGTLTLFGDIQSEIVLMDEDTLKKVFPMAYEYFETKRDILSHRDMDDNVPWYGFGRSQGLSMWGRKKLVFKKMISREIDCLDSYILDEDTMVYSGFYITVRRDSKYFNSSVSEGDTLKRVSDVVRTPEFMEYLKTIGRNRGSGYMEIAPRQIGEFRLKDFSIS